MTMDSTPKGCVLLLLIMPMRIVINHVGGRTGMGISTSRCSRIKEDDDGMCAYKHTLMMREACAQCDGTTGTPIKSCVIQAQGYAPSH